MEIFQKMIIATVFGIALLSSTLSAAELVVTIDHIKEVKGHLTLS